MLNIFKTLAVASLVAAVSSAASFNPVTQFSTTTNTATNLWSYWGSASSTVASYPGSIAILPDFIAGCGSGTTCWDTTTGVDNLILDNASGAAAAFPNSVAPNNALTFYTRNGVVLLRFLVPTSGTYAISGAFTGAATVPQSSQDFIAVDGNTGSPLLNVTGALAFGSSHSFNFSGLSLNAGDTVDFLVAGASTTSDSNSISTSFTASITNSASTTPEPASVLLSLAGLTALILRARRA